MISRIHNKLGTAGFVVAIVALVAALSGAAIAANGLTGKQKKEVKKIAKQFAGQDGAPGAPGPKGDPGAPGAAGKDGAAGQNGADGASPEGTSFTGNKTLGSVTCTDGGIEYKGADTNLVCNGKKGAQGIPGEPGEPGEDGEPGEPGEPGKSAPCATPEEDCVLPAGVTETGVWSFGIGGTPSKVIPLSFNIPLESAPEEMHFVNAEGEEAEDSSGTEFGEPVNCLGSVNSPTAPEGMLCVYTQVENQLGLFFTTGVLDTLFRTGATLFFTETGAEGIGIGTWAVTAK